MTRRLVSRSLYKS